MFDSITIDKSVDLPKPDNFESFNFHERSYQTKDLNCLLAEYRFKDGEIQERKSERIFVEDKTHLLGGYCQEKPDTVKWVKRADITDYICFYDLWNDITPDSDVWLEYSAHIVDGNIKDIKLVKFDFSDNSERKKREREFREKTIKHNNRKWFERTIDSIRYHLRLRLSWLANKHIDFAHWILYQIYKL
jgi:hypothetical protein